MAVRRTADDLARSLALSQSAVRARLAQEDTYTHEISCSPNQGTPRHTNTCQPGLGPRPRSPARLMIDFFYISLSYSYDCPRLKLTPQRSQYFTSNLFSIQRAPILVPKLRFEWFFIHQYVVATIDLASNFCQNIPPTSLLAEMNPSTTQLLGHLPHTVWVFLGAPRSTLEKLPFSLSTLVN